MRLRAALFFILLPAVVPARDLHYGAVASDAVNDCDQRYWQGRHEDAARCYTAILASDAGFAERAEAAWALGDRQAANTYFRRALDAEPDNVAALVRWGDLYAASHQQAEAMDIYTEALEQDPANAWAMLGAAGVLADRFSLEAGMYIERLLGGGAPAGAQAGARLLLARISLENGDFAQAEQALDAATDLVEANGWPLLEVFALRAALDVAAGQANSDWTARSLAVNPHYGGIYATPAHMLVIRRRYREAIDLYQAAVEIEPGLAHAHEQLGINLLRDNQVSRARRHLEEAYSKDPYSPQTVNALRLLDSFSDFRIVEDRGADGDVPIILRLHEDEADIIAPYAIPLIRRSIAEFTPRYGFELEEPVIVEMYPDHDDFAVRTSGMPGLGILGAAFGYVVAMDSPSGRPVNEFQWGTTLWHEVAHVFTLGATDHLVPRWFSEGVSVYEEWRSGPNRGVQLPTMVLQKMAEDVLLPVTGLDEGFIRPAYEGQVIVSYMQAGLVCRFIEAEYGEGTLAGMLAAWREGGDTRSVIEDVLGVDPGEFDAAFSASVQAEFGDVLAGLDEWRQLQQRLAGALADGDWAAVEALADEMLALRPEDVSMTSPYLALATAQREQGRDARALATLEAFWRRGGYDPAALVELARGLHADGSTDRVLDVFASIMLVDPLDEALHGEYGEMLLAAGRPAEALREFEIALAQSPHDMAAAWYRMAAASAALGRNEAAQGQLLEALTIAPNYRPAQKLLLEVSGADE